MTSHSNPCHPERSEGSAGGWLLTVRLRIQLCLVLLLVSQIAIACTIVEVQVPPKKVGGNVTIVALKDHKPLVGVPIVTDRLGDVKAMKPVVRVAESVTDTKGEITLRQLTPAIYIPSVLENDHTHWLASIEVSTQSDTDHSRVEFELLPEAPPPPVPPPPRLVQRVAGQLHDPSGAVFADTQFHISRLDEGNANPEMQVKTNARGEFSLEVPNGNYELRVAVRGFNPAVVPLEFVASSDRGWKGIDLTLELAKCGPGMNPYLYSIKEQRTGN